MSALEQAEREARQAASASADSRKRALARFSPSGTPVVSVSKMDLQTESSSPAMMRPPKPPAQQPWWACCLPMAAVLTPKTPVSMPRTSRHVAAEAVLSFYKSSAVEVQAERAMVEKNCQAVQRAFDQVASFAPVDEATRLGWEKAGKMRRQMWELVNHQVSSGLGAPTEDQLTSLWNKYDGNRDGQLSRAEVRAMLCDYAGAMVEHCNQTLKNLSVMRRNHNSPFAHMVISTFELTIEAQLALHRAHVNGRVTEEEVSSALNKLDINKDGRVERAEFMEKAPETFFGHLLEVAAMQLELQQMATEPTAPPTRTVMDEAVERAEREAKQATMKLHSSKRRLELHQRRSLGQEGREMLGLQIVDGTRQLLKERTVFQGRLASEVRAEGAIVQIEMEMATRASQGSGRSNSEEASELEGPTLTLWPRPRPRP